MSEGGPYSPIPRALPVKRLNDRAFEQRLCDRADAKRAIARTAAALVEDGDSVALDSSTTAWYVACELRRRHELVVVTCSLRVAAVLADAPGVALVVAGGLVQPGSLAAASVDGGSSLAPMRIDMGFFGARGLCLDAGLLGLHPAEARATRELAAACVRVVGVVDATKWQSGSLVSHVPAERLDALVTDAGADPELVDTWRSRGVDVLVAPSSAGRVETFHPRS